MIGFIVYANAQTVNIRSVQVSGISDKEVTILVQLDLRVPQGNSTIYYEVCPVGILGQIGIACQYGSKHFDTQTSGADSVYFTCSRKDYDEKLGGRCGITQFSVPTPKYVKD